MQGTFEYVKKVYYDDPNIDYLIDSQLSNVSVMAAGASMFATGGMSSALFFVGFGVDGVSAYRSGQLSELYPSAVGLTGIGTETAGYIFLGKSLGAASFGYSFYNAWNTWNR